MNRQLNQSTYHDPSMVSRPPYLDYLEDEALQGELDANLPMDKDVTGKALHTRARDSQRYVNLQMNYKLFEKRANN